MVTNYTPTIISGIGTFIFGILFLGATVSKTKTDNSINTQCSITDVKYTEDINDASMMVQCDCGFNCKSNEGMCIKVFVKTPGLAPQMIQEQLQEPNKQCTFEEEKCKEKPRSEALKNTKTNAEQFIQKTNKTIPCIKYNNQLYLEDDFTESTFNAYLILFSIASFFTIVCVAFQCCSCPKKKERSNNNNI